MGRRPANFRIGARRLEATCQRILTALPVLMVVVMVVPSATASVLLALPHFLRSRLLMTNPSPDAERAMATVRGIPATSLRPAADPRLPANNEPKHRLVPLKTHWRTYRAASLERHRSQETYPLELQPYVRWRLTVPKGKGGIAMKRPIAHRHPQNDTKPI